MAEFHGLAAVVALGLSVLAVPWALLLVLARAPLGRFFVANVVWVVLAVVAASLVGLVMLVSGSVPTDPLHLLYGGLAVAVWPAFGLVIAGRSGPRVARFALIGAVVALILVARLFMTAS